MFMSKPVWEFPSFITYKLKFVDRNVSAFTRCLRVTETQKVQDVTSKPRVEYLDTILSSSCDCAFKIFYFGLDRTNMEKKLVIQEPAH